MTQAAALLFLVVALTPAVALALCLDLQRADARRRTRDRLRGPRRTLQRAKVSRLARRPTTADQVRDLRDAFDLFRRALLEAFAPAVEGLAHVARVLSKTGNPPGRRPELRGSDERISR